MRPALFALVLVLFATSCGPVAGSDDGECPEGSVSAVSVVIDGNTVSQGVGACAGNAGAGVVVTLAEGYKITVGTGGMAGSLTCTYEGNAVATMDRTDGSGDRWEASPGGVLSEANCLMTVSQATSGGTPLVGSFEGNLARGLLTGGVEVAQVRFTFDIPPVE